MHVAMSAQTYLYIHNRSPSLQANQLKGHPAYKSPSLQANQPTAMFVNLITQSNSMHEGIPTGNLNARNGGPTCTTWPNCRERENGSPSVNHGLPTAKPRHSYAEFSIVGQSLWRMMCRRIFICNGDALTHDSTSTFTSNKRLLQWNW